MNDTKTPKADALRALREADYERRAAARKPAPDVKRKLAEAKRKLAEAEQKPARPAKKKGGKDVLANKRRRDRRGAH